MRFVRQFAFLRVIALLAILPVVGVGCTEQPKPNPPASGELSKTTDATTTVGKSPKKKGRTSDPEGGSTTGSLGVKPPKDATTK
jgi:hypothetical protein